MKEEQSSIILQNVHVVHGYLKNSDLELQYEVPSTVLTNKARAQADHLWFILNCGVKIFLEGNNTSK